MLPALFFSLFLAPGPLTWVDPPAPAPAVDARGAPLPEGAIARIGCEAFFSYPPYCVGILDDGKTLVLTDDPRHAIRVVDLETAAVKRRFPLGARWAAVAGSFLAVNHDDRAILVYDLGTGEVRATFDPAGQRCEFLWLSTDGSRLAVGGSHQPISIWDVPGKKLIRKFDPEGALRALKLDAGVFGGLSSDLRTIAAIGFDPRGDGARHVVFDVDSGAQVRATALPIEIDAGLSGLLGHGRSTVSDDLKRGAFATRKGDLLLWDLEAGRAISRIASESINGVAFSPDGTRLAFAGDRLRLIDVAGGKETASASGRFVEPRWSPDGKRLLVVSEPVARVFDGATLEEVPRAGMTGAGALAALSFVAGDAKLRVVSADGRIGTLDVQTGKQVSLERPANRRAGAWLGLSRWAGSLDGSRMAGAGDEVTVFGIADLDAAPVRKLEKGRHKSLDRLALSPDGSLVATVGEEPVMRLYNLAQGKESFKLEKPGLKGTAVAFSPDGKLLGAVAKGEIKIWDAATGKGRGAIKGASAFERAIAFSPDGRLVATGGVGGDVWDVGSGEKVASFRAGDGFDPQALAFSSDGKLLAAGGGDGTILVWRLPEGK